MAAYRTSTKKTRHPVSDAEAFDLVMEMMAIPGRSGEEAAVMDFIRGKLVMAGIPDTAFSFDDANRHTPIGGQVGNMIFKLPGTVRGPRRMLAAHSDTVPICVGSRPLRKQDKVVSGNKDTGLGADDRSGAAVLLTTALAIQRARLDHPPLTFVWTVQEETGLYGVRYLRLSKLGNPRLAFNYDGDLPHELTIGATGGYRMTIEIEGIASHAGNRPEAGVSAISIAALAIADLTKRGWHGLVTKDGSAGTSNVGVIEGGQATNVVTEHVRIRAEARSHDPKFRKRIVEEIETAFREAASAVRNTAGKCGRVKIEGQLDYESFCLSREEPCVVAAREAIEAEGLEPEIAITNGGLDANWLTARGIPTVTLGCGQHKIHTVDEELHIGEFHQARRIALRLATTANSK